MTYQYQNRQVQWEVGEQVVQSVYHNTTLKDHTFLFLNLIFRVGTWVEKTEPDAKFSGR